MNSVLSALTARLKEPSTWAGIGLLMPIIGPVAGLTPAMAMAIPAALKLILGVAGTAAIVMPEGQAPTPAVDTAALMQQLLAHLPQASAAMPPASQGPAPEGGR